MALINFSVVISVLLPGVVVVAIADVPIIISVVDARTVGGNAITSVEGAIVTTGILQVARRSTLPAFLLELSPVPPLYQLIFH